MQRPTGVTILAVVAFVIAGAGVLFPLLIFARNPMMSSAGAYPQFALMTGIGRAVVVAVCLGMAALYLVVGVGLWKVRNWGRILTIVLIGLNILTTLPVLFVPYAEQQLVFVPELIDIVIVIWILVYLFRPRVKQAFGAIGF